MGQIPNKTYTAPDGSTYRVKADGSVTKIKGGRVQSNEPPSKYQISPDGKIYRVESDGSVTYLGNAEERTSSQPSYSNISQEPKEPCLGMKSFRPKDHPQKESNQKDKLLGLEKIMTEGGDDAANLITTEEVEFVARYSQNDEALSHIPYYKGGIFMPILVQRYEQGATFLEQSVFSWCLEDTEFACKMAVAKCNRKFADDGILTQLGKDKNPQISHTAKNNHNYTGKGGGCFSVILLFIISTATIITTLI